ncbi:histidine phosphatase family protein [bacterium]|nr:histidine phosphatase family protein [bacterium]
MVRVWLVRHGETEWNAAHRIQGVSDVELSDEGRSQAKRLRSQLEGCSFDTVWSSDLVRATETATIIRGEPTVDPRLRELDFGDLEGLTWQDLEEETRQAMIDFDSFDAPNGESVTAMRERILSFLEQLPEGDHLVVTHGGVVRMISDLCGHAIYPAPCEVFAIDWAARAPISG